MRHRWDEFELDVPARRLTGADGDIHLEPQVFDVLALLVEQHDRVVPKEEILDAVWGDQFVSESALTTRIKEARRAVGDDGRTQRYIRNFHGRGYRFVGELQQATAATPLAAPDGAPRPLRLALDLTVDDEFGFVGRHDELAAADELLGATRDGSAHLFIGGAAGAGKSRLAVEVLERAADAGWQVCAGRCDEHGQAALQPVRDAFSQLASVHPDRVAAWCAGVEGPLLSLIPSLAALLPQEPVAVDAYAGIDAFVAVFEKVAADGPLLLFVDDLQWSDEPTRALLGRLHRRLADRPLATVHTFRSGRNDLPRDVEAWIQSQRRSRPGRRLDLGDLDAPSATELVTAVIGGDRREIADLVDTTGGNCLFLTESLRDLQLGQSTSTSVAELITARLDRQPDPVQALIRAGALLGAEFSFATAAAAAGLELTAALEAIDVAVDAELLHETASPTRFRFSHQLVPAAIADAMGRRARALTHSECAAALRAEDGDDIDIAFHVLGAVPLVPLEEAVEAGRAAASSAIDHKQFDRAIRLLQRVLDTGVEPRARAEVLLQIGGALVARGTTGAAVPYFEDAAELGRRNGWPDILADAALGHWGRSPFRRVTDTSTLVLLREADEALGPDPSLRKARVRAKMAAFSVFTSRLKTRARQVDAALEMAPDATGVERMELLESKAVVFTCPAGIDQLDEIDPELEELRAANSTYFADAAAPETRLLMRARGDALRRTAVVDDARTRAQPISEWRDAVLGSTMAAFAGDFAEARRLCDVGGSIGEPYWGESTAALHAMGHLFIDCLSGEWGRAAEVLAPMVEVAPVQVLIPPLAWAQAASGDGDSARETAALMRTSSLRWLGEHILGGNSLIAAGEAALALDDDRLAAAAERALLPFDDLVLGVPWACSLAAADTLSRLAARRGDADEAQRHRGRARTLYTDLGAPALLARVGGAPAGGD